MDCCEILMFVMIWNLALTTALLKLRGIVINNDRK